MAGEFQKCDIKRQWLSYTISTDDLFITDLILEIPLYWQGQWLFSDWLEPKCIIPGPRLDDIVQHSEI